MTFSIDRFYALNRRLVIWLALLGLLWVMRDFFLLVFVTFVLTFLASTSVSRLQHWLKLTYRINLVITYVFFLLAIYLFVRYAIPSVVEEANAFTSNLGAMKERIIDHQKEFSVNHPNFNKALRGYLRSTVDEEDQNEINTRILAKKKELGIDEEVINTYLSGNGNQDTGLSVENYFRWQDALLIQHHLSSLIDIAKKNIPLLIKSIYHITETLLLSLLLSFLFLFDKRSLLQQLRNLENSRLRDFYLETAEPIAQFGIAIGRGIQAQALIASVNTLLTMVGLLALSVPAVTVLSLIVFVFGFIPVAGTFISTVPIALVAFNAGSFQLVLSVLVLIVMVHLVEAYYLNPLIYGRHFKLNMIIVILILFISHRLFGVWGMVLGVPVVQYFIHYVLGVQVWKEAATAGKTH